MLRLSPVLKSISVPKGGHTEMDSSHREQASTGLGSLTPTVVLLATIVLVILGVAVPLSGFLCGPLLVLLGVRGRREARAAGLSTIPSEVAILAGFLLIAFSLLIAGVLSMLLPASQRTVPSPRPLPLP